MIKLKDLVIITRNSRTKQVSFCLKARQLKKKKITPEQLLEMTMLKPKREFYKKDN